MGRLVYFDPKSRVEEIPEDLRSGSRSVEWFILGFSVDVTD